MQTRQILIAEDSLTQAMKLQFLLEENNFSVQVARDGQAALEALEALQAAQSLPQLVITDIEMPRLTGYELCHAIKTDAKLAHLPVMLLTSLSDPADVVKGLECQADTFVIKPYNEEFLLARIEYILGNQDSPDSTTVFFAGKQHELKAQPSLQTALDMLLGTYETAIQKNRELTSAKESIERQAEELARTSEDLRAKNELMQADLDLAREIQNAFIQKQYPSFPHQVAPHESALRFYHRWIPTTTLGGDFFDVLALSETQSGVFICDVMGHGVRSALVTAMMRALVGERTSGAVDPGRFMGEINRHLITILQPTNTPMFASAFYLVADVETGQISYSNAGHPSPILLRRPPSGESSADWLLPDSSTSGPALGVFPDAEYETLQRDSQVGDLLWMFTDGLVEVEGEAGEYGEDRLLEAARRRLKTAPSQLFDEVIAEIRAFGGNHEFEDDVCLVAVEVARLL